MTRHCRQIFGKVAASTSGWSMNAGVCFGAHSSLPGWDALAAASRRPRVCEWLCISHSVLGFVLCLQGIQRAYSGTSLNLGGMCSAEQQAHEATHHFSVLSTENNNLFCAHWAQLYIIRAQKLFGCFWAAGCLHRWRTGYGDCGLSAAGDFCGLWSEANSSWESQNACNSSTVCHRRRLLRGKREGATE